MYRPKKYTRAAKVFLTILALAGVVTFAALVQVVVAGL